MRRFFTALQRRWLLNQQRYRCAICGKAITLRTAHADHVIPFSRGGGTELRNAQALCRPCNLFKSNNMTATAFSATAFSGWLDRLPSGFVPRQWQVDAINGFHEFISRGDFSCSFTAKVDPGFGKTLLAALAGKTLLDAGRINWTVVLVPNQNLVDQTIGDAPAVGLQLTPDARGLDRMQLRRQGYHGEVLTYSMLLANQLAYEQQASLHGAEWLLVKDEVHRLADSEGADEKAWSAAVAEVLHKHIPYRIAMTGTLFRSDEYGIQDVPYGPPDEAGIRQVLPHFGTRMPNGIQENWVRRLLFFTNDAQVQWLESRGESMEQRAAELSDDRLKPGDRVAALQTALDVRLDYAQAIIRQAYERLQQRRAITPDAAMIVICKDANHARDVREWIREELGVSAPLVLGEDSGSRKAIERFKEERASNDSVIVAVKMISEGCSIRRLEVGVLLTNITTRLNFLQTGARCNRNRTGNYETGEWHIPALPEFLVYALEYEKDILHSLVDAKDKEPRDPPPPILCPICEDPEGANFTGECPGPGVEPCPRSAPRKVYRVDSQVSDSWGIAGGESFGQELWVRSQRVAAKAGLDVHLVAQVLRHVESGEQEACAAPPPPAPLAEQLQEQLLRYNNALRIVCSRLIDLGCQWPPGEIKKAINQTALQVGHVRNSTRDPEAMRRKADWVSDVEACVPAVRRYMEGQR